MRLQRRAILRHRKTSHQLPMQQYTGISVCHRHDDKLTFLKSNYKYKRRAVDLDGQRNVAAKVRESKMRSDLKILGDHSKNHRTGQFESTQSKYHSDKLTFSIILRLFIVNAGKLLLPQQFASTLAATLAKLTIMMVTITAKTSASASSDIATVAAGSAGANSVAGASNDDINGNASSMQRLHGKAAVDDDGGAKNDDSQANYDKVSTMPIEIQCSVIANNINDSIDSNGDSDQCEATRRRSLRRERKSSGACGGTAGLGRCQQRQTFLGASLMLCNFSTRTLTTLPRKSGSKMLSIFMTLFMVLTLNGGDHRGGLGVRYANAGACWQSMLDTGKCNEIYSLNITKTECCSRSQEFSYTDRELTSVEYFFATTIGGGMECVPCMESCRHVKCGPNKKCVKRKGRPKCVCAPKCGAAVRRKQQQQQRPTALLYPRDTRSLSSEIKTIDLSLKYGYMEGAAQQPPPPQVLSNQRRRPIILADEEGPRNSPVQPTTRSNGSTRRLLITTAHAEHAEKPTTRRLQVISNVGSDSNAAGIGGTDDGRNIRHPAVSPAAVGPYAGNTQIRRQKKKQRTGNRRKVAPEGAVDSGLLQTGVETRLSNNDRIRHIHQNNRPNMENALSVEPDKQQLQSQQQYKQRKIHHRRKQEHNRHQQQQQQEQQQQHYHKIHPQQLQPPEHQPHHHQHHKQPHHPHHRQPHHNQRERHHMKHRKHQGQTDDSLNSNIAAAAAATRGAAATALPDNANGGSAETTVKSATQENNVSAVATPAATNAEFVAAADGCQTTTLTTPLNSMSSGSALDDHHQRALQHRQLPDDDRFSSHGSNTATSSAPTAAMAAAGVDRAASAGCHGALPAPTTTWIVARDILAGSATAATVARTATASGFIGNNSNQNSTSKQPDNMLNTVVVADDIVATTATASDDAVFVGGNLNALNFDDLTLVDGIYDNRNRHGFSNQPAATTRQDKQQLAAETQSQQHQQSGITQQTEERRQHQLQQHQYESSGHTPHPVCGTDGRTYNTECQLKKRSCRTDNPNLTVAYHGHCRTTCNGVKCLNGLTCVEDHYTKPHCIPCQIDCPYADDADLEDELPYGDISAANKRQQKRNKRAVCGVDGKTYRSICDINRMICEIGRSIAVAYPGPCLADRVTCSDVNCGPKHTCLVDLLAHEPRCVYCRYKCPRKRRPAALSFEEGKICGVNNRTYHSWCEMRKDSCATGFFIDVKAPGVCQ